MSVKKEITEASLLSLIRAGGRAGFDRLYDTYSSIFYGCIYRVAKDHAAAHELLQELFVTIWRDIDQYDESRGRFDIWMHHLSRKVCANYLKRNEDQMAEKKTIGPPPLPDELMLGGGETPMSVEQVEDVKVIDMIFLSGYSCLEASEKLGIPIESVRHRMRADLMRLRRR